MKKSKLLWYFIAFIFVINVLEYLSQWGGERFLLIFSDTLPIICSLVSAICLFYAFRGFKDFDFTKRAWILIFIGISLDFIAENIYSVLEIYFGFDMNERFPSIADLFWLAAYIPLIIGLLLMVFGYKNSGFPLGKTKLYILLAFIVVAISAVVFYYVLLPILQDTETSRLTKLASLFYPIADILVVIPAIMLMYITSLFGKGSISKPWKYLTIGFLCFTGSDLLYDYLSWQGTYGSGNLIDLGWNIGYLLIGMAGLYQRELLESIQGGRA
jgi:uncharacterized membrane protein YuzA (DUF378 family)